MIPGSPAQKAGFESGDVIVAADGEEITSADDLIQTLIDRDPGDEVTLDIVAPEGARSQSVTLVARPPSFAGPRE